MASHIVDLEAAGMIGDVSSGNANNGVNGVNNAAVWNSIIPAQVKPGDVILLPSEFVAISKPLNPLPSSCTLQGCGSMTKIVRCFSQGPNDIFLTTGILDSFVDKVRIFAADGTSGGVAIGRAASSAADAPFHTVITNLDVTRFNSGNWSNCLRIDGRFGQPMYGARRIFLDNINLSGCTGVGSIGCLFGAVNDLQATNIYVAGSIEQWGIWWLGVANNPCAENKLEGAVGGTLLYYSTLNTTVVASGLQNIIMDANCSSNTVICSSIQTAPAIAVGHNNVVVAGLTTYKGPA